MEAGCGELEFERVGARTIVRTAHARSPLHLMMPRSHGEGAWVFTTTFGGGLVDGDDVRLRVSVDEDAAALLTTQASTKVYRSPRGCSSVLDATIGARGLLISAPDPLVCYAGARSRQRVSVSLAPDASVVLLDALSAGRVAFGERWAFARHESLLEIERAGIPVLRDAIVLDPTHGDIAERMARFDFLATIVLAGPRVRTTIEGIAREVADSGPVARDAVVIESASHLDDGLLVRIMAVDVERGMRAVRARLGCIGTLIGEDPFARKG